MSWGSLYDLYNNKVVDLSRQENVFGRSKECSVVIKSANCSKRHFSINLIGGGASSDGSVAKLVDLGSMNGTFLNGQEILRRGSRVLAPNDDIEVKPDRIFIYADGASSGSLLKQVKKGERYSYFVCQNSLLGSGTSADVKRAYCFETKKVVACKIITFKRSKLQSFQRCVEQEVSVLPKLTHPGIVQIYDIVAEKSQVMIFLEFVAGGELRVKLDRTGPLPEMETKFIVFQLALALEYIHSQLVCHRDLKLDNILLASQRGLCRVLLSDFGMSKITSSAERPMKTVCGTPEYSAPEVILAHALNRVPGYDTKVDSWSLGVTLYIMLSGHLPFEGRETYDDLLAELKKELSKFGLQGISKKPIVWRGSRWSYVTDEAKDLVQKLLCFDPRKRLSVSQVLSHPWISSDAIHIRQLYDKLLAKSNLIYPQKVPVYSVKKRSSESMEQSLHDYRDSKRRIFRC